MTLISLASFNGDLLVPIRLIDCHCHFDDYLDQKIDQQVIQEALKNGIIRIVGVGMNFESSKKILNASRENGFLVPCVGIHPWESWKISVDEIRKVLKLIEDNVDFLAGIGEVGLDYRFIRGENKWQRQREVFELFVKMGAEYNLALNIHVVGAEKEVVSLLNKYGVEKAVFHWYTGSFIVLQDILSSGYYISINLSVTYSKRVIGIIRQTPLNKIVLESDSPYEFRGILASPSHVRVVADKVAEVKKISVDKIAEVTTENAKRLFNIEF